MAMVLIGVVIGFIVGTYGAFSYDDYLDKKYLKDLRYVAYLEAQCMAAAPHVPKRV